jgi:hypothetical protein
MSAMQESSEGAAATRISAMVVQMAVEMAKASLTMIPAQTSEYHLPCNILGPLIAVPPWLQNSKDNMG